MNIFDIIGPVMIGPSSSHTAGAARIGRISRLILGARPVQAEIGLVGSFARTYRGHGTDKALVAGILGMMPDDAQLKNSLEVAERRGLSVRFYEAHIPGAHPNTARVSLTGEDGVGCQVEGASVGGGNILIKSINGMETAFSGTSDTLIVLHMDFPGTIAAVTGLVAASGVNIGNLRLSRPEKGRQAVLTIEIDSGLGEPLVERIRAVRDVLNVVYLRAI